MKGEPQLAHVTNRLASWVDVIALCQTHPNPNLPPQESSHGHPVHSLPCRALAPYFLAR